MAVGIVKLILPALLVEINTVTKCYWMSCSLVNAIMDSFLIMQILHVLVGKVFSKLTLFYS